MINQKNFKKLLKFLNFEEKDNIFNKNFKESGLYLRVDFKKEELIYPESAGLLINERQTCNFASSENVVVFECVYQLLNRGYKAQHIELEPKWKLGHGASGGRADILIKNQSNKPILIIECKTYGKEFNKAWKDTKEDGGQLFSYAQQISETDFLCLYASEFDEKNGQIIREQRIVSHKDNEKILEQDEMLKSYKKATNVKRRFDVWRETYQLEYTQTGIFESNIQAYQIGKNNYTLEIDTRPVRDSDKDGKYHRFRTILRQHNIARKETAFEVLVNLFLAKIVDEEENKENLEFYWKGIAYDNYYDFIDRLQKLYQIGMERFLKDKVTYISNEQIDNAFWTVKNERNATKKEIKKYFRELKFFSNNAFSLINVHNERLFNQNTKVLVELVQMWQGLRLKTKEQNQFLGDMFEYFLDNSIKQSEGQFFTPMPITKFIVASLPLEARIKSSSEPLRAIDYACGSGHFLTEYAHQIKPLVEQFKDTDIGEYYKNIVGIEKEDRLAKIAKVSAYMYGQEQINILEKDALSTIKEIEDESFDVLVANPPFAVEGFLLNLDEKQKQGYELINTTEMNSNTNNIQCFFIERAKQIIKPNGVMGIIVPSSILSNSDATHIGTREIILKYFDIVSIVELGGGTFGKTGTNTVVLFLKRKSQKPEPAEHYANRVEDYFDTIYSNDSNQNEYQDLALVKKYCEHTELPFEQYIKLFGISTKTIENLDELFKTDIFTEYKKDFENSTPIKNLKKKKTFKDRPKEEQKESLDKKLIAYLYAIEKEKLLYFILAYENPQKILIVKSPSNNKVQKKFLGYEWSGAKGQEGIKYSGGGTVNDILTPLFNSKNRNDSSKINHLIQQNFLGAEPNDLTAFEEYKELISYANVEDIIDFSRKDLNKAFSLTSKKSVVIESRWELVKLENIVDKIFAGGDIPKNNFSKIKNKKHSIPIYANAIEKKGLYGYTDRAKVMNDCVTISARGTLGYTEVRKEPFFPIVRLIVLIPNSLINVDYLKSVIDLLDFTNTGSVIPQLTIPTIKNLKIPLAPKEIQEKIVEEYESIDSKVKKAKEIIEKAQKEIEEKVKFVFNEGYKKKKLEDICNLKAGKFVSAKDIDDENNDELYPCFGGNGLRGYTENFTHNGTYSLIGRQGALCGNVHKISGKFHATEHAVVVTPSSDINTDWFYYILVSLNLNKYATGVAQPGLSVKNILPILIPVPSLSEQKNLVAKIEILENKISQANAVILGAKEKKQSVMEKYLR